MKGLLKPLVILLAAGMAVRLGYVLAQPASDPTFARPILDGAYYVALAKAGVAGAPAGPFYMPPLYPAFLAAFFAALGASWSLLYLLQHLLVVLAAGALGLAGNAVGGRVAGLAAAAIVLLYHPALFFASRPLGEPLAVFLLAAGVALVLRPGPLAGAGAGFLSGCAALARPNLLPLPVLWGAGDAAGGRVRRAGLMLLAAAAAILPVTCRNFLASGSLVPVSANGGVVFWLGNGPGAIGVYTPATGFSGKLETQQAEAVALASSRAGRPLDAVAADRYWLREGLRVRASDPGGTAVLLLRRLALTLDDAEHGLDYAPALDRNPLRWLAPLPFAVILGLAVAGTAGRGFKGTGGWIVWSAIGVNALVPLAFYVSSRHRLPFALLLAIPAGVGIASLRSTLSGRRGRLAASAGLVACVVSFALPTGAVVRSGEAGSLAVLADVYLKAGDLPRAAETARRAASLDPGCVVAWFNLGVIEEAGGRKDLAEPAYRAALAADPHHAESAGNLSALLLSTGRAPEAIALLEPAVLTSPGHAPLWTNLVVGLVVTGQAPAARDTIERARRAGITLNPELVRAVSPEDPSP